MLEIYSLRNDDFLQIYAQFVMLESSKEQHY